jgi:hypothetical protein
MRSWIILIAVLLAAFPAVFAGKEDTLEELKTRAESARLQERPALCTEIAQRQVETADQLYSAGKVEDARAAVNDAITYSDKAHDAATRTGKKLKNTEIALRKMALRLRDIKRTLAFEEQGPVQAAIDHLERLRTELLARMFGKKEEK